MAENKICGRFAPSPSGRMHLGNIFCALLAWLSARSQNGNMLLRIEDLDTSRCTEEKARVLMDDLLWLGLDWDYGAAPDKPADEYYQSRRSGIYKKYFDELTAQDLIYPCFCSRAELHAASAPHASDGHFVYPGTCRRLTAAQRAAKLAGAHKCAWRIKVPGADVTFDDLHYGRQNLNLAREWGDFIVRRSDGIYAYQLAVVIDDALMGVTEVIRGSDLLTSTAPQLYLYKQLGFNAPQFGHLPLLTAPAGRRLAKRDLDLDMGALRQHYKTPEAVIGKLAFLAGLIEKEESIKAAELIPLFYWQKIPKKNIVVN